jgi:hypothetical protein
LTERNARPVKAVKKVKETGGEITSTDYKKFCESHVKSQASYKIKGKIIKKKIDQGPK